MTSIGEKEFNKIIKYWSKIEKLEKKINNHSPYVYINIKYIDEYLDIDEVNNAIDYFNSAKAKLEQYKNLKDELEFIKTEYNNYIVNELGY